MLQIPVGFATTCVTVTSWPFDSVETATLVISGGIETVVCPRESVVEMTIGVLSVVSGGSVIVLVAVGVCAFICWAGCEIVAELPALALEAARFELCNDEAGLDSG